MPKMTLGEALVALARQVAWPSEPRRDEVVDAIEREFELGEYNPVTIEDRAKTAAESPAEEDPYAKIRALEAELAKVKAGAEA